MRKAILLLLAALLLNPSAAKGKEPPALSAECAVLAGMNGEILLEKNADARRLIASTTKLMTALVALEHGQLTDEVTVPAACCGIEGSSMYLQAGEKYTVQELLTGLLLASGNDAALALALHCGGNTARFVAWMNEKAAALGMENSHFANPHGLDDPEHYGTAADLAKLMAACLREPELAEILALDHAVIREQYYGNHNKLLGSCPGCLGGKTGYTQAAGRCLVSACERDGTRLICVTLNAPEDWNDHKRLYDWGFAHYVSRDVCKTLSYRLPVYGGDRREIELRAEPLELLLPKDAALQLSVELPGYVLAPVRKGEIGGRVTVFRNGRVLGASALRFTEEVKTEETGS